MIVVYKALPVQSTCHSCSPLSPTRKAHRKRRRTMLGRSPFPAVSPLSFGPRVLSHILVSARLRHCAPLMPPECGAHRNCSGPLRCAARVASVSGRAPEISGAAASGTQWLCSGHPDSSPPCAASPQRRHNLASAVRRHSRAAPRLYPAVLSRSCLQQFDK